MDHYENIAETHAIAAGHYANAALDQLEKSRRQ